MDPTDRPARLVETKPQPGVAPRVADARVHGAAIARVQRIASAPATRRLQALLHAIWMRDRVFFVALTLFSLFCARKTLRPGIWADNDSVCHYAYLRHLVEDFYPATGTFFGWTPKYNLGTPFLVYNTPPGIYVAAALIAAGLHQAPLVGLKVLVLGAYLAVPLLGARLARTFEVTPGDLPKFVALALSLFSSELLGLEFYLKMGMLNPAVAVPLLLATLVCLRQAQLARGAPALRWVALGAVAFAATAFVHLLTAYMLAISLGCFAFASGWRRFGRSAIQIGIMVGVGVGLVGFWLVPSLPFGAKEDAAYTWIRNPLDTLSGFLDGSVLSSYFVGFYPHFYTFSAVGMVVQICAGFALVYLVFRWNPAVAACAATAIVGLLAAMGPRPSFGLWLLPMYDRLLWYRFMTLAALMTQILGGWGAWRLWCMRAKLGPAFLAIVAVVSIWAVGVMYARSLKIATVSDGKPFLADVDAVSGWLRDHAKPGGRVYSEFLAHDVVESVSVNYPRHMIPVLSGVPEASGWIYENSETAQLLLKRGLLWYSPFPIVPLAERYDVQYVVAGSPNFVRALAEDPRWRLAIATTHLSLFEAVGREPALVEGDGWNPRVVNEGYLRGGGYEYAIEVAPRAGTKASDLLVKTSWSPAWHATVDGKELAIAKSDDGLVRIQLPGGTAAATISLRWEIDALRAKGNRVSLAALVMLAVVFAAGSLRSERLRPREKLVQRAGVGAAALVAAALCLRAHPVDEGVVGFGVRGGMLVTFDTSRADVGAFDDAETTRLTRVLPAAWGARSLVKAEPARHLAMAGQPALVVTLSPSGTNRITIVGSLADGDGTSRSDGEVVALLSDPGSGRVDCRFELRLGEASAVPGACLQGAPGDGPGVQRTVSFETSDSLVVTTADVDSGVVVVEAESMHNALDDDGYEAFYEIGPPDTFASNGVSMHATAGYAVTIALDREVALPAPRYDAWILSRTMPQRLGNGMANVLMEADGQPFADLQPRTRAPRLYWDDDPHWEWLPAGRLEGNGTRKIRVTFHKMKDAFDGMADLDAIAFVPSGPTP